MHDAISPLPRTTDSPTIPSRKPLDAVLSTNKLQSSKSSLVTRPSTVPSLREMSEAIEKALGFSFKDLFSWGDDKNGPIMLDRRAFLLYHPEDHLKELDLITRCLMGHHVEIGSAWFEGSWQAYAQKLLQTGSGVVFVSQCINQHLTSSRLTNIPRYTRTLSTTRNLKNSVTSC
jgi:hypothetical protein